jgi:hypothetical protein
MNLVTECIHLFTYLGNTQDSLLTVRPYLFKKKNWSSWQSPLLGTSPRIFFFSAGDYRHLADDQHGKPAGDMSATRTCTLVPGQWHGCGYPSHQSWSYSVIIVAGITSDSDICGAELQITHPRIHNLWPNFVISTRSDFPYIPGNLNSKYSELQCHQGLCVS